MDYKALAQQNAQDILGYSQDTSGWKVAKSSKKITVSSKPSKTFHGNMTHSYVMPLHKVLPWAQFPPETLST